MYCSRKRGKKLADFYETQNDHIAGMLKPLAAHTADGEQEAKDMAFKVKLAVNISFFANCCLAILQLYSAISSLSLALFATATDSGERCLLSLCDASLKTSLYVLS